MPAPNPVKTCPGCTDVTVRAQLTFEQQCSPCRKKERNRLWREANPGVMADTAKRWREAGNVSARPPDYAEKERKRRREAYKTDPEVRERVRDYGARYRKEHPEKVAADLKKWVNANREKVRTYNRERARALYQTEAGKAQQKAMRVRFKVERRLHQAAYNAKRYGEHGLLDAQFLNWLHKWQDHCCGYCNAPLKERETIEHIVPLFHKGTNLPHNALLSCGSCNFSKNSKLLDAWKPAFVASALRFHSHYCTRIALKMLVEAGIAVTEQSDHLLLPNRKKLFVLSSFWMAERMGPPPVTMQALAAFYPEAVFTFDYEWQTRPAAMLNIITAKAGVSSDSIGARKLTIAVPTLDEARLFMNQWHLQGFSAGSSYCGLRDLAGDWRAMCSITLTTGGLATLGRLAFKGHVTGGFSRLIAAVTQTLPAGCTLVTYADSRLGDGEGYLNAGFMPQGNTVPSFHYVNAVGLYHWNTYTKTAMAKKLDYFQDEWPAWRLARTNGLWRIDDLPLRRFTLQF